MTEASLEIWNLLVEKVSEDIAWKKFKDVNVMPKEMQLEILTRYELAREDIERITECSVYRDAYTFNVPFNPGHLLRGVSPLNRGKIVYNGSMLWLYMTEGWLNIFMLSAKMIERENKQ